MLRALLSAGGRAVALIRVGQWANRRGLRVLAWSAHQLNLGLHGCDISPKAQIGRGLRIYHPVGIVAGNFKAGEDLVLAQNVTIGNRDSHESDGRETPILGNNVTINAGAVVIGPINIGDGVVVGANAVVVDDVASGLVVVGVPARALRSKTAGH